jgi:serralysin
MLRSLTVGCLLAAAATSLAASPAPAATLSRDPDPAEIVYVAAPGEENRLTISRDGDTHVFTEAPGVAIVPAPPCSRPGPEPNVAVCPLTYAIDVSLGDLDDTATLGSVDFGYPIFRGGEGEDTLTGSSERGSTSMIGGPGRDSYVNGTGGFDTVGYSDRAGPVTASLDDVANDPDGENIPPGIDALGGTEAGDTLIGGPEGDFFWPGGGDDLVRGMGGSDEFFYSPGDDRYEGGDGNDAFPYTNDPGADVFSGGDGFDRFQIVQTLYLRDDEVYTVTLDDVADDGPPGATVDDVRSDIEDVK